MKEVINTRESTERHKRMPPSDYEMMDPFELTKNVSHPLTPKDHSSKKEIKKIVDDELELRLKRIRFIKD